MTESYMSEVSEGDMKMIKKAWPELNVLWSKNVGDYQGTIYVIGYVDNKVLVSGLPYGSCLGCGEWQEPDEYDNEIGGQPTSKDDFIEAGVYGKTLKETLKWADEQSVDLTTAELADMKSEIRRAFNLVS